MGNDEPREPATPEPVEDDNDLARPVPPPAGVRPQRGERHLTRRVIAPAALLVVSVPVVALLFLNLRAVSDDDSTPAGANTSQTSAPAPSASPSTSSGAGESEAASPTPTRTPEPSGPSIEELSTTSGSADGGQTITVRGDDLDPVTQVLFGPLNGANLEHVSSSELRITTPPGAGSVQVTFKAGADDVDAPPMTYTYA